MRIITIVGMSKSGKTSTTLALIEAIRKHGKKAGVCKSMLDPAFTIDQSTANTMRYRRAGSELTCTRAKGETVFLHPEEIPLSKVLENYKDCDYVLLEDDYFAPVPRLVCAQQEDDALTRMNSRTFAFAGRISEKTDPLLPLPCFNARIHADSLLDYIDARIPNILPCSMLDDLLPPAAYIAEDSQPQIASSSDMENNSKPLQVIFHGKHIHLSQTQEDMLLSWIREAQDAQ